ncbi:hypothetical protein [Patiriisocius sp. Uisw_047]|uniref:hypothetical protein n=1 Tax=Patiriisocius sp. Uisw_047 TaxID=3230969 RepID=UPI0039E92E45
MTFLFACYKLDQLTQFDITYNEEGVIESSVLVDLLFNVYTPDINSNSESAFENNNTHRDLIEHIELSSMILEIKSPSNGNFDFLKSIETFISAEDQPEARMAWKEVIPSNSDNLIELNTSSDDLQNYLKEDKFTLRVETVTDELITSDHTIDINSVFFVDAKILGI